MFEFDLQQAIKTKTIPDNQSEINQLKDMITTNSKEFEGDRGYNSKENRRSVRAQGIRTRNKPMTIWLKKIQHSCIKKKIQSRADIWDLKKKIQIQ